MDLVALSRLNFGQVAKIVGNPTVEQTGSGIVVPLAPKCHIHFLSEGRVSCKCSEGILC